MGSPAFPPLPIAAPGTDGYYVLSVSDSGKETSWSEGGGGGGFSPGGDLSGSGTDQTVIGIQTIPVSNTAPTTNQVLEYNGSEYAPTSLPSSLPPSGSAGGDLIGTYPNPTVAYLYGNPVANFAPSIGEVLTSTVSGWKGIAFSGGDVIYNGSPGDLKVTGIQGIAVSSTPPSIDQVLVYNPTLVAYVPQTISTITSPARPASDGYTLLDYRFNETASLSQSPVLINHGSFGLGTGTIGPPGGVTTTANYTQPAVGSTVAVSASVLASTFPSYCGLIKIAGGGYYSVSSTTGSTWTLKNLGIVGINASAGTVISSGSAFAASGDLIIPGSSDGYSTNNLGPYDWCWGFNGTDQGSVSNYGVGSGGVAAFTGITQFTMHALVWSNAYTTTSTAYSMYFGYSHAQTWGTTFRDIGFGASYSGTGGQWAFFFTNQTPALTGFTNNAAYPMTLGQWILLSATVDMTKTTNAVQFYKNGQFIGTDNLSATSSLALGSAGYWYCGNPNGAGGDTSDFTNGMIAMCRFENTIRSASYVQTMYQTIFPQSTNFPVP